MTLDIWQINTKYVINITSASIVFGVTFAVCISLVK